MKNRTLIRHPWLLMMSLVLFQSISAGAQCVLNTVTAIPDDDQLIFQISVSGLLIDDLASPTQGVCGIDIRFTHEYLGDLTVTLISPSGTMVQLIGPPTTSIPITNLSVWDVSFLPCGDPVMPDPGFTDTWSNLQNWSSFTPYNGSYHPFGGCLEDFDNGPANGLWQIIFEDHDLFQLGIVEEITLIFCDPTGLQCQECQPNAGTLTPASFHICSGQNIQSSDITVDYGGQPPAPGLYTYEYMLVQGNTILQSGVNFSLSPPAGLYTICGLNYLNADVATIDALIDAGDYATLQQAIDDGAVCADLTDQCVQLTVTDQPDTMVVSSNLCQGEIFSYGGQQYTTDGIFYQVHDGPGLCDTVFEIRISPRPLMVTAEASDTLTCSIGTVMASAVASGSNGPFNYLWTTTSGNIVSPPNVQTITVDQSGQYLVEVTDGICEGSSGVFVFADQGYPQVFFEGGTITCNQPAILIEPIFIPTTADILWTFPDGSTSNIPDISATIPGTYTLSVTNAAGCTTTRTAEVLIDTMTYPVNIIEITRDCQLGNVTLGSSDLLHQIGWDWTGPNGFATNYWRPVVTDPGLYSLTVTYINGCTRSATYPFAADFTIPDIQVTPVTDTLNCNEVIPLTVSSTTPGVSYYWSGPGGFSSGMPVINVNQPGVYYAIVTAPNGCVNSLEVAIVEGDDVFDYTVFTDTITCTTSEVTIGVISAEADQYDWINYAGPGDDQSMITVSAGGLYQVLMTDSQTGCMVAGEVFVFTDVSIPAFSYARDTITCFNPVAELSFVPISGQTYSDVYWELPDLTIVPGPVVQSNLPGEHRLYGVGGNGCLGIWHNIHIPFDTLPPFIFIETDSLICHDSVEIISQSLDSITSYQWTGPGIIEDLGDFVRVNEAGWYHLSATGLNGCQAEIDILVDSNYVLPVFTVEADTLRCDQPATLTIIPSDPVISFAWYDDAGMLISQADNVDVTLPGTYTIEVEGTNQCVATDSITIDPLIYPEIGVSSDTLTCSITSVPVEVTHPAGMYSIEWFDNAGNSLGDQAVIMASSEGPFIVAVTGQNACETRDTITVPYDSLYPVAVIEMEGVIKCQERDVTLNAINSTPDPLIYLWSTTDGMIISDPSLDNVMVRDTGFYMLVVESPDNGCRDTTSILVEEDPTAIMDAVIDITPPECSGDVNAAITIAEISGGISPFFYQLNGGSPQSSSIFDGLDAGTYLVQITDHDDCVFDTTVIIAPTFPFTVDAGPDQEIYIGEEAQLMSITDLMPDEIQSDHWDSSGISLCDDCPAFMVSPLETTTYTYHIESATGCQLRDDVIIYVLNKAKYYIPNIFSPNGDGINDEVRINASPGVERILQWVIFDRWGNAVYGKIDFEPTDTQVFWDGRATTGDFCNPGVFAYMLEIQLISGKRERFHGDITLLR